MQAHPGFHTASHTKSLTRSAQPLGQRHDAFILRLQVEVCSCKVHANSVRSAGPYPAPCPLFPSWRRRRVVGCKQRFATPLQRTDSTGRGASSLDYVPSRQQCAQADPDWVITRIFIIVMSSGRKYMKLKCFYRRQLIQEKRLGKGAVAISIKNTFPRNIEIMSSSLSITIRLTQLQKNIYTPLTAVKNGGKILNVPVYPPRVEKFIEQFLFVNLPKNY